MKSKPSGNKLPSLYLNRTGQTINLHPPGPVIRKQKTEAPEAEKGVVLEDRTFSDFAVKTDPSVHALAPPIFSTAS